MNLTASKIPFEKIDNSIVKRINATKYLSFSCSYAWTKTLQKAYNIDSFLLLIEKDEKPLAGIVMTKSLNFFKKYEYFSPAFSDHGGLIIFDNAFLNLDKNKVYELIQSCFPKKATIRLRMLDHSLHIDSKTTFYNFRLILRDTIDDQWSFLNGKVRNQIRKAQKNNLQVVINNKIMPEFLDLYFKKMKQFGTPPHSKSFFKNLIENFRGNMLCVSIKDENEKVFASALIIFFQNVSYVPYAASNYKERNNNSNMLLYWELVKLGILNKTKVFDFGRSFQKSGTYKFKAQWEGKAVPLYYETIDNGSLHPSIKNHIYQSTILKFASKLWGFIPIDLSIRFGFRVRMFLP